MPNDAAIGQIVECLPASDLYGALPSGKAEQAVLAEIRAMRAAGKSYRTIADELTERGVPTKKGNGRWSHMAVVGIVKRDLDRRK